MTSEFVARQTYKTDHSSAYRFIVSHILRHPIYAVLMILGAFSNAAFAAAVPYFIGQAFTAINERRDIHFVGLMVLAIIVSQLVRAGLQIMRNFSAEVFAQRIERDVRDELYASLLGKSMSFHDFQPVGEIMARVTNDVREMNLMMNPGMNLLIGSGMILIMPMFAARAIHPQLSLTPFVFLVVYVIVQLRYMQKLDPISQTVRASFGRMNADVAETLEGLQVVKGGAQEQREIENFNRRADEVRDAVVAQGNIEAFYLPMLLYGLALVAGFVHVAALYRAGEIEVGGIVGFMGQLMLFVFPVYSSIRSYSQLALGYASARRILNIITTETELDQNARGYAAPIRGEITFERVNFGYVEDGQEVIHDVSFAVKPGQTVAIAGQTGAGKTTLTKLINRTYDTNSGRVLVDGVDVRDWNLASLRSQISIIEQDIFLFSRSVADNIRFGKPEASLGAVIAAAKKAQAHEFIMEMPEGYDTIIGQRGVTLSGGQRQRLAIARAFLTDPPVLILDDSTSAIDSATEDKIQQAIWTASRGRTTLLITHRLSQIRWADHIVVMRQGRVVAQGTHEELLASSEAYRRIFARYEGATAQPSPTQAGMT